jgi:hypothetical protein
MALRNPPPSPDDLSESVSSVLNSRIDQAIAITPAGQTQRIAVLEAIRAIEYPPMRLASLSDYLLDYIASLSLELNSARIAAAKLQDSQQSKTGGKQGTVESDYEQCLRLLRESRDRLSIKIERFTEWNEGLRQRHKADRARIARKNKLIARLSSI